MDWQYEYTPYVWPMLASAIINATLCIYVWRRRTVPGATALAAAMLFATLWSAGATLEIAAVDFDAKVFWFEIQGVMKIPAATAELCFGLQYANLGRLLTRRNLALLSIIPLLALILILTNDAHHWMWMGFVWEREIRPLRSPFTWVLVIYTYLLALTLIAIFVRLFIRSPHHRWLVVLILGEVFLTRYTGLLDMTGVNPFAPMEPTILFWNLGAGLYALALFGFRMFDPIPMARKIMIEQMGDGMLVLDAENRIADLNPAAQAFLYAPRKETVGREVRQALGEHPALQRLLEDSTITHTEIQGGNDSRWYEARLSPLLDTRGSRLGQLLLLHDVTEQKRAQAQLMEQQRALAMLSERERLARELHDDLGQVLAFINTQGQTVRRLLARSDYSTADDFVARMLEVTREADVDLRESILGLRASLSGQGLIPSLQGYLQRFEQRYGIQADLMLPEASLEQVFEPVAEVQILRILQEGLTNARKHANAHCVKIAFELQDGGVQIIVQDDGKGFEPSGLPDDSRRGFGLEFMRERAENIGGSLEVCSAAGEGTCLILTVPRKGRT